MTDALTRLRECTKEELIQAFIAYMKNVGEAEGSLFLYENAYSDIWELVARVVGNGRSA